MPHRHHDAFAGGGDEAASPRPSAVGCYAFLRTRSHRAAGACAYHRLDSAAAALEAEAEAVRVEVGTTTGKKGGRAKKSVFHVDPAVLEAGPVRRLLAAAGRRAPGGGVAVDVDALLFEHLLWLATKARDDGVGGDGGEEDDSAAAADDLSDIVEFYSQDDDDEHRDHGLSF